MDAALGAVNVLVFPHLIFVHLLSGGVEHEHGPGSDRPWATAFEVRTARVVGMLFRSPFTVHR